MATLARRLFAFGRPREEELQQKVTALEHALSTCGEVAGRWTEFRREVTIAIAAVCLVVGFVLGVYRDPIVHFVAHSLGLASRPATADAAYAAYQRGDYTRALQKALPLASAGDASAESLLGLLYYRGRGTRQDLAEAVRWF